MRDPSNVSIEDPGASWGWLENIPGVELVEPLKAIGGNPNVVQGTFRLAGQGQNAPVFRKRIEALPGGYRVGGRYVQWQQRGLLRDSLISPESTISSGIKQAVTDISKMERRNYYGPNEYQREGEAGFHDYTERFPGLQRNWSMEWESEKLSPGNMPTTWHTLPPALQARVFSTTQIRTRKYEDRDVGKFGAMRFPGNLVHASRGKAVSADELRWGRFPAWPVSSFAGSTEAFSYGAHPRDTRFVTGFAPGKAAKRFQLGAQEIYPLEGRKIAVSPFRTPGVQLPGGQVFTPPRERGNVILGGVLLSGMLPEGMGQVNLPRTFEERYKTIRVPLGARGTYDEPLMEPGPAVGPYSTLQLGRTKGGRPINYTNTGHWTQTEVMRQDIEGGMSREGAPALVSRIRRFIETGIGSTSYKAQGMKALEVAGTLPGQLGVEALYPSFKNPVGFAHNVLSAWHEADPERFAALWQKHGFTNKWSGIGDMEQPGKLMAAAQELIQENTVIQPISLAVHRSLLPSQGLRVLPNGQLAPMRGGEWEFGEGQAPTSAVRWQGQDYNIETKAGFIGGKLREGQEDIFDVTLAKPMYVGPLFRQARREYRGRDPFVSPEEINQIANQLSPGFAQQLRRQSTSRKHLAEMFEMWESAPLRGRSFPFSRTLDLAKRKDLAAEVAGASEMLSDTILDRTQRNLTAYAQVLGERPIHFSHKILGKERTFALPSPETIMRFMAEDELGEEVNPLTVSYSRLLEGIMEGASGRMMDRLVSKYTRAAEGLTESSQFKRKLTGALPRHATEGVVGGDLALGPRQVMYSDMDLASLAGINLSTLDTPESQERLRAFKRTIEERHREQNPITALFVRRPISHAETQIGASVVEVLTQEMGEKLGATTRGATVASPWLAALGKGDFDADRWISLLLHQGRVEYSPDVRWRVGTRYEGARGPVEGDTPPIYSMLARTGGAKFTQEQEEQLFGLQLEEGRLSSKMDKYTKMRGDAMKALRIEAGGDAKTPGLGGLGVYQRMVPEHVRDPISRRLMRIQQLEDAASKKLTDVRKRYGTLLSQGGVGYPRPPMGAGASFGYGPEIEAGTEQPGFYSIRTPDFALKELRKSLPKLLSEHTLDVAGRGDPAWNEMLKWEREQQDWSKYHQVMGSGWLSYKQGAGKGPKFGGESKDVPIGALYAMGGWDIAGSYMDEMVNKGIAMTGTYNMARQMLMQGLPSSAVSAFMAVVYQKGLDKELGFATKQSMANESLKTTLDMWNTYSPGAKKPGWFQKFEEYVGPGETREGKLDLNPRWRETSQRGPAGFAAALLKNLAGLRDEITPEHLATLVYGANPTQEQVQAVVTGDVPTMFRATGAEDPVRYLLESPTIVRTFAARRAASAAKKWAPTPATSTNRGNAWAPVWDDLVTLGQQSQALTTLYSSSFGVEGEGNLYEGIMTMGNMPGAPRWLARDIMEASGMYTGPGMFGGVGMQGGGQQIPAMTPDNMLAYLESQETMVLDKLSSRQLQALLKMQYIPAAEAAGYQGEDIFSPEAIAKVSTVGHTQTIQSMTQAFSAHYGQGAQTAQAHANRQRQQADAQADAQGVNPGSPGGSGDPPDWWNAGGRTWGSADEPEWSRGNGGYTPRGGNTGGAPFDQDRFLNEVRDVFGDLTDNVAALNDNMGVLNDNYDRQARYRSQRGALNANAASWRMEPDMQNALVGRTLQGIFGDYMETDPDIRAASESMTRLRAENVGINVEGGKGKYRAMQRQLTALAGVRGQQGLINKVAGMTEAQLTQAQADYVSLQEFANAKNATVPQLRAYGQLIGEEVDIRRAAGTMAPRISLYDPAAVAQAQADAQAQEAAAAPSLGQKISAASSELLSEFSFGGAYFKLMGINRLLGQPQQGWRQQAAQLAMAQAGMGIEMGASTQQFMATPLGQIAQFQARSSSFSAGMGEANLLAQAGMADIITPEGASPYQTGRALGKFATPIMSGAQWGLGAGVIASTVGNIAGAAGFEAAGAGIVGASGPIGIAVGGAVTGAMLGAEAWQMAEPANLQKEVIEIDMGYRGRIGRATRPGPGAPSLPGGGFSAGAIFGQLERDIVAGFKYRPGMQGIQLGAQAFGAGIREAGGLEEYMRSKAGEPLKGVSLDIAEAQVHIEHMEVPGLDEAGKANIAGLLTLTGVSEAEIARGGADKLFEQYAGLEMTGRTGEVASAIASIGGSFGVVPGAGMRPYADAIINAGMYSSAGIAQVQTAGQLLGNVAGQTGAAIAPEKIIALAQQLGSGTTTYEATLQLQQEYGTSPIVQAMGYTPGGVVGKKMSQAINPQSLAQAQMIGSIGAQFGGIFDVMGFTPTAAAATAQMLEFERNQEGGRSQYEQMRQWQNYAGLGAAQAFGYAPGSHDAWKFMENRPTDYRGAYEFDTAAGYAAGINNFRGGSEEVAEYWTQKFKGSNASPTAKALAAQAYQGGGAVASAAGGGAGAQLLDEALAEGLLAKPEEGGITAQQYQAFTRQTQIAFSQQGYNLAAIAQTGAAAPQWAQQLGQQSMQIRQAAGKPLLESAQPLIEFGPGGQGIYQIGQQESMALSRQSMIAQQQYSMGTGPYATQSVTVGGQTSTYQMGLIGDIGMQRQRIDVFQQQRALGERAADVSFAHQNAGIDRAMESATLQYHQGMESLALQQTMWAVGKRQQREQMGIAYQRMGITQEWANTEAAFQREATGKEFAWGMEDMDEAIKYATGRQKRVAIRQKERAEERFAMQTAQMGRGDEQREQRQQWEQEDLARQRRNFEEITGLEAQQFAMRKRHLTESYEMQMKHLAEQKEELGESYALQKEMRKLSQDQQEEEMKYRLAEMERQKRYWEEQVFPTQQRQQELQEEVAKAYADYTEQQYKDMAEGGKLWNAWESLVNQVFAWLKDIQYYGGSKEDVPPEQMGGGIVPGKRYWVGESGPEFFVSNVPGQIIPNHDLPSSGGPGGSSGVTIGNVNITIPEGNYSAREVADMIVEKLKFENMMSEADERLRYRGDGWYR